MTYVEYLHDFEIDPDAASPHWWKSISFAILSIGGLLFSKLVTKPTPRLLFAFALPTGLLTWAAVHLGAVIHGDFHTWWWPAVCPRMAAEFTIIGGWLFWLGGIAGLGITALLKSPPKKKQVEWAVQLSKTLLAAITAAATALGIGFGHPGNSSDKGSAEPEPTLQIRLPTNPH